MLKILDIFLPIFLVVLVGFFWGKKHELTNQKWMGDVIFYLTSPALVFTILLKSEIDINIFFKIALSGFIVVLVNFFLAKIFIYIFKIKKAEEVILPVTFINTGNIGLPLSLFAFGQAGLSIAVIFHSVIMLGVYSFGVWIISPQKSITDFFRLPHIYVFLVALLFNYYNLNLPLGIFRAMHLLGQITIPLMLFLLGVQLSKVVVVNNFKTAFFAACLRFWGGILGAILCIKIFDLQNIAASTILLLASLPSAVVTQLLIQKYYDDSALCTSIVVISTLFSLLTIPLVLFLV